MGVSLALDVAREHGLPEDVLTRAEKHLLIQGGDTSALMERMNTVAVDKERELAELKRERIRLKEKEAKLRERFEQEKAKLLDEVQAASRSIVKSWQEGKVGQKKARQDLADLKRAITGDAQGGGQDGAKPKSLVFQDLKPGQKVHYTSWSKDGRVVDVDERKQQVKVDLSGVALWVDFAELAPVAGGGGKPKGILVPKHVKEAPKPSAGPTLTLDLRGQRGDVAVAELADFLDKAILRGAGGVEVIHGRGTGALRREVHDFLKRFPAVAGYRLADEDHGGDGKTVVDMK